MLADMPREEFARYLLHTLNAGAVVIGYNFRFGAGALGTPDFLKAYASGFGVPVEVVKAVEMCSKPVSSTRIREALRKGDVSVARELLGRPYSLQGTVRTGDRLGRALGFPTANIEAPEGKLLPGQGVYITLAEYRGREYPSITNIGVRPTVSGSGRVSVETHMMGFSAEIYGKTLHIQFLRRLRQEQRFENTAALVEQLEEDKAAAIAYFAGKRA